LFPKLQEYSIEQKQTAIRDHFLLQLTVGWILVIVLSAVFRDMAFFIATFWPPSRFPVFIMGVLGGLIRLEDSKSMKPISSVCCCWHVSRWRATSQEWASALDKEALVLIISFVVVGFLENLTGGIGSGVWFQLMLPYSQFTIVYGLSMDEGLSVTSKILRCQVFVFFGTIGYALFLVHEPLIQYIC